MNPSLVSLFSLLFTRNSHDIWESGASRRSMNTISTGCSTGASPSLKIPFGDLNFMQHACSCSSNSKCERHPRLSLMPIYDGYFTKKQSAFIWRCVQTSNHSLFVSLITANERKHQINREQTILANIDLPSSPSALYAESVKFITKYIVYASLCGTLISYMTYVCNIGFETMHTSILKKN